MLPATVRPKPIIGVHPDGIFKRLEVFFRDLARLRVFGIIGDQLDVAHIFTPAGSPDIDKDHIEVQ